MSEMRSFEEFQRSLRNYTWLKDAASGATDLDFLVERRGWFLVMEFKPWMQGVRLPLGQFIVLEELAKLDSFTVCIVGEGTRGRFYLTEVDVAAPPVDRWARRGTVWFPKQRFVSCDKDGLSAWVAEWYQEAKAS